MNIIQPMFPQGKNIAHWKELKTLKPYTHIANFQGGEKMMSPNYSWKKTLNLTIKHFHNKNKENTNDWRRINKSNENTWV
jgi:hypothetical protein